MTVVRIHLSMFIKTIGQKQHDNNEIKIIMAKKQDSINVADWATSTICCALTFLIFFKVLWIKLVWKEILWAGSALNKKVGLFS